jgi:glycosyltransferase involved in cell wall biosynthesis
VERVSAVLIVKNEEACLARCLESVKGADEIIICDTGSTDRTLEIAKQYTDKIFTDYTWNDNFADARNHAKSKASCEWILSIDADEVLLSPFADVRAAINLTFMAANVLMLAEGHPEQQFWFPKLFRNSPQVWWIGAIHNHLSVNGEDLTGVKVQIVYGYSPAHFADRGRTLRILEREVATRKDAVRETFYLGREYFYREMYDKSVIMLGRYVQQSRYPAERADAFLIMSRAFWAMRQADDARDACVQALIINPHFKEACLHMATLAGDGRENPRWQRNADQWKRMAQTADNQGVLFIRGEEG